MARSSWRRTGIAMALAAWTAAMAMHVAAFAGASVPDAAVGALCVVSLVTFVAALFSHPRVQIGTGLIGRRYLGHFQLLDVMRGASAAFLLLTVAAFAYALALIFLLPASPLPVGTRLSARGVELITAYCGAFLASSCMAHSSARNEEALGLDPLP